MISSIGSMNTGAVCSQRPPAPPKPEEKFQELDVDGTGSLDLAELQVMAEQLSEMTGMEISAEDMMSKLDVDGNGSLEVGEMPEPPPRDQAGPPPFLAADGSVQDSSQGMESFNPLESLLSYLDSDDEETAYSTFDLQS